MKSLLIAASVAAMTIGGAALAASGSEGSPDNPMAGRNGMANQPGSSATSGGSMRDPGGNKAGTYQHDPKTGAANTHPNTGPQTGPAHGSSGSSGTTTTPRTGTAR
jgi:hypothetical protein